MPKTKASAVVDKEAIMDSDEESVKSEATRKSENRLNKHCTAGKCDGKLISGKNWAIHTERKHSNAVVSYRVCIEATCDYCKQSKLYTWCTRTAYFLYPDRLLFVPGPPTFCTR